MIWQSKGAHALHTLPLKLRSEGVAPHRRLFSLTRIRAAEERSSVDLIDTAVSSPYSSTGPSKLNARQLRKKRIEEEKTWNETMEPVRASTKKLGQLARQIAGKPIDHAITQMQFSPKKVSWTIIKMLREAKEKASQKGQMEPTKIYIDQAWVGKHERVKEVSYRGRGRTHVIKHRWSHLKVMLKEEATMQRRLREKEDRLLRRRVWTQLSDRPIYNPKPYYVW